MNRKLKISMILIAALFAFPGVGPAGHSKPLPPLKVSIVPVAGINSAEIKPGDVVELKVTAVSFRDVREMRIDVHLSGGAKLISGETSWNGPSTGNEEKSILLTVQTPGKGTGVITARVSIPPSNGARFSSQARFVLGSEDKAGAGHKPAIKKDSKGRNIIEYR